MLINDFSYFKESANYRNTTSGIDYPDESLRSLKDWHGYPIQDFDYQFNSWGFRGPEYTQYIGKSVNICLGDSFTVNVGGPIEHSWCSQLAKHFDIPTFNLGMDGAGNDAIGLVYTRACELFDVKNVFVMYSFFHRRLENGKFLHFGTDEQNDFLYFINHRLQGVYEVALPYWCWNPSEKDFLKNRKIYYFDRPIDYASNRKLVDKDRKYYVNKKAYNRLRGDDWPTYNNFINGADPHEDTLNQEYGEILDILAQRSQYTNRDGLHCNFDVNKDYADHFYNQWKIDNES